MKLKNIEIKLKKLNERGEQLMDKLFELKGEKITLETKLKNESVNPILFILKISVIDFEYALLHEEMNHIAAQIKSLNYINNLGMDIESKDL
jgi:hypothetical protein